MSKSTPSTIFLSDYKAPSFTITDIELRVELGEEETKVTSHLKFQRQNSNTDQVRLHGENLKLEGFFIDEEPQAKKDYTLSTKELSFIAPSDEFETQIITIIKPQENTALEGLYKSSGNFCTQCEAEGFRKITYYLDRPDVMARFTTTIVGDASKYPVMLSNGNLVDSGETDNGLTYKTWVDPFPKPAYLFALVAGDLACVEDNFTTMSGRDVTLQIFVEKGNEDKCDHAMESLKKSMKWDEEKYGREYDLDIFMIVAVSDFNMGAMENKGLNIFNSKYVLASKDTATDADYDGIESVIAHEYFHNWTGNRITCRDWFQLTLKEGLTVFRDQQFSADMNSYAVKRIEDVQRLRAAQYPEDAGPLAHPIQPQSYVEINNFYTATVYEKGAEVIRMAHTLLGEENYRKGMDLYFDRHDGQAVTTEEFIAALEDGSGVDLKQFRNWYVQPGTPAISVEEEYDPEGEVYSLNISQTNPKMDDDAPALHIPLKLSLYSEDGEVVIDEHVIDLKHKEETFDFLFMENKPVPSLFQDFSAPVKVIKNPASSKLDLLLKHDRDPFNRWEAGQQLAIQNILKLVEGSANTIPESYLQALQAVLEDDSLDTAFKAAVIALPSEQFIGQQMRVVDVDGIHQARKTTQKIIALNFEDTLKAIYDSLKGADNNGARDLKNLCLSYLCSTEKETYLDLASAQYFNAQNMTDRVAALSRLISSDHADRDKALQDYYDRFEKDALVIDKWFTMQAVSSRDTAMADVQALLKHPAFTMLNPNRVRSLIAAFASANPKHFHNKDGSGYEFLTTAIIELNKTNPQIAARLVGPLGQWRRHDSERQQLMKGCLKRILEIKDISNDVYEVASKSLGVD